MARVAWKRTVGLVVGAALVGAAIPVAEVQEAPGRSGPLVPYNEMRASLAFRKQFGLRSDQAFVEGTLRNAALDRNAFGVPLYDTEIAELGARAARGKGIVKMLRTARRSDPRTFAGL